MPVAPRSIPSSTSSSASPSQRIHELLAIYGGSSACAAWLLCDQYNPEDTAYRIVRPDLFTEELSYGDLRTESEKFAAALQSLGVGPGDRVATLMGKSRAYLVTLLGIWRLGAVHVPLFTAFAAPAIATRLLGSKAKIVVCDAVQRPKLASAEIRDLDLSVRIVTTGEADDRSFAFDVLLAAASPGLPAVVLHGDAPMINIYTSGTTGNPKSVLVPIRALAAFRTYAEFGLGLQQDDVFWCAADPGWAYGLYFGVLASLSTGTLGVMLEGGFSAETTWAVLAQEEVTNFAAAPTVYRSLGSSGVLPPSDLPLRFASSAGEPLTPEINDWALSTLGVEIRDHYGQTEMGMLINNHQHPFLRRPSKPGSMGQAMPGWTAVVLHPERDEELGPGQVGRVAITVPDSPLCWFKGYADNPVKAAEKFVGSGRYYLTGDMGSIDEDGYFFFSGRDDDVIIMAGYRIGPHEVEAAISSHPAVFECAVIAVPDEVRGEVVEAYVVLSDAYEASPDLARDIQQRVKTHYAAHAYPRAVHFIDKLPKTPSGKIQRFVLKQDRIRNFGERAVSK